MPERVQMSRQRPWRADHPDAVIVARPGRWGNPFLLSDVGCAYPSLTHAQCAVMVCQDLRGLIANNGVTQWRSWPAEIDGGVFGGPRVVKSYQYPTIAEIRAELAELVKIFV